jgi:protease-4
VVLRGLLDAGFGKVQELRDAIVRFRKSGKPAYAHLEFAGNKEFYLASACDKIFAVPTAILDVTGLAAEVTFYKGTLDKVGVEASSWGWASTRTRPTSTPRRVHRRPPRADGGDADSLYTQYVGGPVGEPPQDPGGVRALSMPGPTTRRALERPVDELLYRMSSTSG